MTTTTRRHRTACATTILALLLSAIAAGPAQAAGGRVDYGYVSSASYCASYGGATKCEVILTYPGKANVTTRPSTVGTINCPGHGTNGMTIYSGIGPASGTPALTGKYVAVLWDGTGINAGTINCH